MAIVNELARLTYETYLAGQFSHGEFRRKFGGEKGGPATPVNFFVKVSLPKIFRNNVNTAGAPGDNREDTFDMVNDLTFLATVANVPGRNLQTTEVYNRNYGIMTKFPYDSRAEELNVSFLVRAGMRERFFFERWINSIVGNGPDLDQYTSLSPLEQSQRIGRNLAGNSQIGGLLNSARDQLDRVGFTRPLGRSLLGSGRSDADKDYNISYYDDYTTNVEILYFDPSGDKRAHFSFLEAYPTTVSDISLDWSNPEEFIRIDVSFSYYRYVMNALRNIGVRSVVNHIKNVVEGGDVRDNIALAAPVLGRGLFNAVRFNGINNQVVDAARDQITGSRGTVGTSAAERESAASAIRLQQSG